MFITKKFIRMSANRLIAKITHNNHDLTLSQFEIISFNFYRSQTLMYLRLFAHVLVGFLIGALYYDIGNDGAKVLSNLGFLFFNMLFLMYTSMTITILSCEFLMQGEKIFLKIKKKFMQGLEVF
jgi:hypothetical protein